MKSKYWFFEKWGITSENSIMNYIKELENRIEKLEHENVETTNTIYELQNSINAVDCRIDIITGEKFVVDNIANYSVDYTEMENDYGTK